MVRVKKRYFVLHLTPERDVEEEAERWKAASKSNKKSKKLFVGRKKNWQLGNDGVLWRAIRVRKNGRCCCLIFMKRMQSRRSRTWCKNCTATLESPR